MGKKLLHSVYLSIILLLAFAAVGFNKTASAAEADGLILNLVSDTNVVEINEDISLYLTINNTTSVKGQSAVLQYDPAVVKFNDGKCENFERCLSMKNNNGQLSINIISKAEALLVTGPKKLIKLNFKALKRGSASIKVVSGCTSNLNNSIKDVPASKCGGYNFTIHDSKAESLESIEAGNGALSDYSSLGLNDINSKNIQFVNADIKACNYTILEQVKTRIEQNINVYESKVKSMDNVINGTASLTDYSNLGITTLTAEVLPYANNDLDEYNNSDLNAVKARINANLSKYKSMSLINGGTASLADYNNIGANKASSYNLCYLNNNIKNSGIVSISKMSLKAADIINNLRAYTVKGVVKDSRSGSVVSGASIKFKCSDGQYLTNNGAVVTAATDSNGNYSIQLPEGNYTAEVSKSSYTGTSISVTANSLNTGKSFNVNITLISSVQYKAELRWGSYPGDLDGELTGTTGSGTNVSCCQGGSQYEAGRLIASGTRDILNGYGPETITFTADYNGYYKYSVHGHSANVSSATGAVVRLYRDNVQVGIYYISVNQTGNHWNVFEIVNGQVRSINNITA